MSKRLLAQRLDELPVSKWHIGMMATCSMAILFDSFDSTIVSVAIPQLTELWGLTNVEIGLLNSGGFFGMFFGAIVFGYLSDIIGRKKIFMSTLVIYSLFTLACAVAQSFQQLLIFRILVGFGIGGLVPVVSTYLSEFTPAKNRGKFLSYLNGFFQLGLGFAYLVGMLIVVPYGWQYGFLIGTLPAIIVVLVQKVLPESTRFLLLKGRFQEAIKIVENIEMGIFKKKTVETDEALAIEKANAESLPKVPLSTLFKGKVLKSTINVAVLQFALNFSTYAVVMWLPVLLTKELGYDLASGFAFLTIAAFIGALGQLSAGIAADKLGRKVTLTYSFLGYAICAYLLFFTSLGTVALLLMWICLGSCWGSTYAYSPENFPTAVRSTGLGFAGSIGRLGGIFGPTAVGIIYATSGIEMILHVNAFFLVIAVICIIFLGTETKAKSLEQIEQGITKPA
ncbi:MAG: MFS transporter [Peptococcaceae bacterium]